MGKFRKFPAASGPTLRRRSSAFSQMPNSLASLLLPPGAHQDPLSPLPLVFRGCLGREWEWGLGVKSLISPPSQPNHQSSSRGQVLTCPGGLPRCLSFALGLWEPSRTPVKAEEPCRKPRAVSGSQGRIVRGIPTACTRPRTEGPWQLPAWLSDLGADGVSNGKQYGNFRMFLIR